MRHENKGPMTGHEFGGAWTAEKLERVRKYLAAYTTIFAMNPRAQKLATVYVDAFAGTGYRSRRREDQLRTLLFPELAEPEAEAFLKGSAQLALEVEPPFREYVFIERDGKRALELERLKQMFPKKSASIRIVAGDANSYLKEWCNQTDWRLCRAVVFLDPYGMQVEWTTIEAIARTQAIDLWVLFPLGVAVTRLLTKARRPPAHWEKALTSIFGTGEWASAFYREEVTASLFEAQGSETRDADLNKIGQFFVERLRTVFTQVADNPLPLRNSRNVPLYLLCFAAGNPRGAPTAIRIARHILSR